MLSIPRIAVAASLIGAAHVNAAYSIGSPGTFAHHRRIANANGVQPK